MGRYDCPMFYHCPSTARPKSRSQGGGTSQVLVSTEGRDRLGEQEAHRSAREALSSSAASDAARVHTPHSEALALPSSYCPPLPPPEALPLGTFSLVRVAKHTHIQPCTQLSAFCCSVTQSVGRVFDGTRQPHIHPPSCSHLGCLPGCGLWQGLTCD